MALAATALAPMGQPATAQEVPAAIFTDPVRDAAHPARMEVLHIPSGRRGDQWPRLCRGGGGAASGGRCCATACPATRRTSISPRRSGGQGGRSITFNYRGSGAARGSYRFANDLEDADAVLAWLRAPANAASLGIDPKRIVMMGHSLGGWVTALTAAHDPALIGAAMISPGNIGRMGKMPRATAAPASPTTAWRRWRIRAARSWRTRRSPMPTHWIIVKAGPRLDRHQTVRS